MAKIVYSSDQLPAELNDKARYSLWRDIYEATYTALDFGFLPDRPFSSHFEFAQYGAVGVGEFKATLDVMGRSAAHIARHPRDHLCLIIVGESCPFAQNQAGRETVHQRGGVALTSEGDPGRLTMPQGTDWVLLDFPREALMERLANAEDLVATRLVPSAPVLGHMRNFSRMLLQNENDGTDPRLTGHISNALLDLAVLALGGAGESAEIARARGLRAARLQETLAEIKRSFTDPNFSPAAAAGKLGLSPRYIHELLQDTGVTLGERVLELRLQKARAMLSDARNDRMKVNDIALACGFNEASYFNRRFRARFGCSPTQYRGGSPG
jgi:AraC-like DNA-binding protein